MATSLEPPAGITRPVVFFDVAIGDTPAGRIKIGELFFIINHRKITDGRIVQRYHPEVCSFSGIGFFELMQERQKTLDSCVRVNTGLSPSLSRFSLKTDSTPFRRDTRMPLFTGTFLDN